LKYRIETKVHQKTNQEKMEFSLPEEMWFKIWSDLDFETLQKTCVLVCQGWFKNIRDDGRLSGQLSLKNAEMEEEEAKAILSKWKELRILRLSKNLDQVDLSKTHKFLKKVIVPNVPEGYENVSLNVLEDYPVLVNKICFNPQDKSKSIGLDNIIELTLHFLSIFEYEKSFEPMGEMKNLIRLKIILEEKELIERILNALGSIKNLEISGMRCELTIPDGFDKPMVKSVMQEALEIIEKKFPFDSTEIEITAFVTHTSTRVETGYSPAKPTDGYCFDIIKEKEKGPSLKIMEMMPIAPKCIKCLKKRANVGKRGMCFFCYKKS